MPSATELALQRAATKRFIDEDALSIILNRAAIVSNGAGGSLKGEPSSLDPQVMRLIPVGAAYGGSEVHEMLDGQTVQVNFHLLGEIDALVEPGDWFFLHGRKHEVLWVKVVGNYEVKAGVVDRG